MNFHLKAVLALFIFIAMSSQVQANKRPTNDQERPQRPNFSSLDTSADGMIDFDEFSSHKLPFGDHQTIFNNIDTDGSGDISEEEFKNHTPPHPKRKKGNERD